MTVTDPAFNTREASEIMISIGELIVRNSAYRDRHWDALTLVANLDEGKSLFGYIYADGGDWSARTPRGFDVLRKLVELNFAMTKPGERGWKTCLIQIKRADMSLDVDFEYDDTERWRITPDNLEQKVEELRPR